MESNITTNRLNEILSCAQTASRQAAGILTGYYGKTLNVKSKPDSSIVSEADQESENLIREILNKDFPEFHIHGEEGGHVAGTKDNCGTWHIDPLDGTTNFVHGFPYFSTSLGLEINGEIVVAVVDAPIMNLSFHAVKNGGAYCNGRRIFVRENVDISSSLLATGFSYEKDLERELQLKIFESLLGKARGIRRPGAAVLDMCFVASGVFDGFWEKHLKTWDMAAGSLIVKEAGGTVTNLDGKPWSTKDISVLAASKNFHSILLNEIHKCRK